MKRTVAMLLAAAACLALAGPAAADFGRYQVIVDRMPFGAEPPPPPPVAESPPPAVPVGPVAPSFVKDLVLGGIIELDEEPGFRISFQDKKQQKYYFLFLGESEDGIEVVDVDYAGDRVLLRKGSDSQWLSMDGSSSPSTDAPGVGSSSPPSIGGASSVIRPRVARTRRPAAPQVSREQYKAEMAEGKRLPPVPPRRVMTPHPETEEGLPPETPAANPEELEARLRHYNLELIRAGGDAGPALPIELTPEEDAQLVREGVLPPP